MIMMKFSGASVQDAQAIDRVAAIVRERLPERSARTSALANALTPNNGPAPEARKSLAPGPPTRAIFAWRGGGHPEASNAKPEGWVSQEMHLSPVGAAQGNSAPYPIANKVTSPTLCPPAIQVSGHDLSRAVNIQKNMGFSPGTKNFQGLKAISFRFRTARLKSCPDTCRSQGNNIVLFSSASPNALLRASVSPWWGLSR
jgi:hypothetical protein